jgi:hypothetical protein
MGTHLPFAIEIVFLMLVLPIAFAYLFSIAGVAVMCACTTFRRLIFRLSLAHRRPVTGDH